MTTTLERLAFIYFKWGLGGWNILDDGELHHVEEISEIYDYVLDKRK